ncbi:MAG: tetraacyldisaccharide 4'-kinase [Rhodobacterales bacterium]|nr:tetraacyldisaccharide 4'-kinase [Rhodobacterales bacterium]
MLPRLLAPLGWLYAAGSARRLRQPGYTPQVPVICVGNLTAGGAGKTPTVIALVERLTARGRKVHVVSRGYGGRLEGPVRVDEARHKADEVGDEPLLLSAFAPVWVAKDRAAGVRAAEAAGAQVILMDDGFQNPAVKPALGLVVVDAARGFGNGRCIPAGPLREPVAIGLARANLMLTIGDPAAQARFDATWGPFALPRLSGQLHPLQMGMDWRGARVLAFAGIADPARFFATLRGEGAEIMRAEALGDHETLSETLLKRLESKAAAAGAQLVTTEKDAARLPQHWRAKVLTLVVRLKIDDWSALDTELARLGL